MSHSYGEIHLIGAGLQIQKFSLLVSWWEAGRHGVGEGAESSASRSTGSRKRDTGTGLSV